MDSCCNQAQNKNLVLNDFTCFLDLTQSAAPTSAATLQPSQRLRWGFFGVILLTFSVGKKRHITPSSFLRLRDAPGMLIFGDVSPGFTFVGSALEPSLVSAAIMFAKTKQTSFKVCSGRQPLDYSRPAVMFPRGCIE